MWQAERPGTDGSSVAILTRALLIGRHLTRARERALEELGTDTPTLDVLAALRGSGAPYRLRTSEIEAASPVTAGAITRRLDRLQARGLVSRERDRRDKRVIHVSLTGKGRDLIDGILAGLMEKESRFLTPFSERERETLERLLTRWLRWLDENARKPPGKELSEMSAHQTRLSSEGRLASALPGNVVLPKDVRFDEARRAWNLAIDQRPAAVAFPESPHDVTAAVLFAREFGLRVAAQGTGHGAGPLGSLDDTILLKTERMRGVSVDPARRTARVEAGVAWLEVVEAAAQHGLAALAGSSPDVGVVGYTLGGGLSFLGRRYGLAANHVSAIEVVTADGRLVRADRQHEQDLFWALRGGGGSFGVVTAIEFDLFPITGAYAGILWYPIDRGPEVLHAWRELTQSDLPDELTTVGRFLNLPPTPEIPEPVRGKSFAIIEVYHIGDPAHADELLARLRALGPVNDTTAPVPMPVLTHLHMEPEQPVPAAADGLMVDQLPANALDAFVEVAGAHADVPLVSIELRHLGGELRRTRPEHGALASIDADYSMYAVGIVPTPELEASVRTQVRAAKAALAPWAARRMNLNFTETQQDAATFWGEQAYDRLRRIKTAVDPDDLIRSNHPIPPKSPTRRESKGESR